LVGSGEVEGVGVGVGLGVGDGLGDGLGVGFVSVFDEEESVLDEEPESDEELVKVIVSE